MFDYLAKFNNLPKEIRDKVSGPAVLATIDELEKKYAVSLAPLVMKVMVKDISLGELIVYFAEEMQMDAERAEKLSQELKERIFRNVLDYLDVSRAAKVAITENKNSAEPLIQPTFPGPKPPVIIQKDISFPAVPTVTLNKPVIPAEPAKITKQTGSIKKASDDQIEKSAFYFSPEDEEEVRELAKKLQTFNPVGQDQNSLDDKIKEIESSFNITFSSEELLSRFRQITRTYLLGIRKRIETKLALIKPFESGGLNLDADKAEKILATADKNMEIDGLKLKKPNLITVPEDTAGSQASVTDTLINRDVPYDLNALANKEPVKKEEAAESAVPITENTKINQSNENLKIVINQAELDELNKNTAKPEKVISPTPNLADLKSINIPVVEKKDNRIISGSYLSQSNPRQNISSDMSAKTRMDDVKFIPKVMGPIDELRFFDLVNYRRLSNDPTKAAAKIKEKIGFLEEEHFNKKIEAIKAWRQSPLNRLYLEVGRQSIEENRPMEVIIEERKNKKQDYLTGQEIEAIMDLNKALRF
jgi:hypothetical protein